MAERAVLIPFPRANSDQFVRATKGGVAIPAVETEYKDAKAELENSRKVYELNADSNDPDWQKTVATQKQAERRMDRARELYKNAKRKGWKNIDSTKMACSDDQHLNAMLRSLKNYEDVLYIRGHCDAGLSYIESSDRTHRAKASDVVDLLDNALPVDFMGAIKLIGCRSACDTIFKQSFARRFAEALADRGFVTARVFGYTAEILTFISDPNGHKTTDSGARASAARVAIPMHRVRASKCCMQ